MTEMAVPEAQAAGKSANSNGSFVVWAALLGNLAIAVIKFVAAALTGSSAMLSEGIHSLVDTGNEALLLYGIRRAAAPPDVDHPFGHGRELYFWSFVVALLIFTIGACVSLYEGVTHVLAPTPLAQPIVIFAVFGASFIFEGVSWRIALREFRRTQGTMTLWQAFRASKDPTTFMVLFEDSAALIGILLAAAGVGLALVTGDERWDGAASIAIGALLSVVALVLARESKALLIGEQADPALRAAIFALSDQVDGIERVNAMTTVQLAPDQVVATMSIEFADALHTSDIERIVTALEAAIRAEHPAIVALFVKPQTAKTSRAQRAHLVAAPALDPDHQWRSDVMDCPHLDTIKPVTPSARGCEECLRTGSEWLHLRVCRSCGHVGCCDQSPGRHATRHFAASRHPIIEGYDPPEGWGWCYIDEVMIDLGSDLTPHDGPIPRYY